jgi:hypothetical protein
VRRALFWTVLLFVAGGCGRLPALTADILMQAEQTWKAHEPGSYRLVIEMTGDRVEESRYEVEVRSGATVSLRRNGLPIRANPGQDYSMNGLFRMLEQELGLAGNPATIGAPPGYSVYTTARFDPLNGRLIRYRRIVGGASNSIDVRVVEYTETK